MIKKVELYPKHGEVFGNPAPLGLLGLAISCFALAPISMGVKAMPDTLKLIAVYCLLFGGGCQLVTGIMDFANKNAFGGAIFTTFAFMWMKNAWELYMMSKGFVPDHTITFIIDALLLIVFVILTYGFGFFSKTLFIFLIDIDLIYVLKILKFLTHAPVFDFLIGFFLALLGLIGLWIAFTTLINPVSGREIFKELPPMFTRPKKEAHFDWTIRNSVFRILYEHWKEKAYEPMPLEDLEKAIKEKAGDSNIVPDLFYLSDYGTMVLSFKDDEGRQIKAVRLNANGIDLYEQLVLKKYEF